MLGRRLWENDIDLDHAGRFSPRAVRVIAAVVDPVVRVLFRPRLQGVENLPRQGPFILAANHSAGLGIAEIMSFAALYLRQVGADRPLAALALPTDFTVPVMKDLMIEIGAIPSTKTAARGCLRAGVPVLVFPGGDHESLRPFWQANRVDFGGRTGFLRLAREAGIPIVPMGIRGAHWTAPPLLRSSLLAWFFVVPRLLGAKRWSISLLGALGAVLLALSPSTWFVRAALIYLWLSSPLTFWPWLPGRVRMVIGAPLSPSTLFPVDGDSGDDAHVDALRLVEQAVQQLVDAAA
jgi:1-acyl-sn-glycerol-3-phosphate acyltransferase